MKFRTTWPNGIYPIIINEKNVTALSNTHLQDRVLRLLPVVHQRPHLQLVPVVLLVLLRPLELVLQELPVDRRGLGRRSDQRALLGQADT